MYGDTTYRSAGAETSCCPIAIDILLRWSKDVRFLPYQKGWFLCRKLKVCATTEPPVAARIASESRESEFPPTARAHPE